MRVENFAQVEDSILFPDVEIGANARIRRAIIDRHVKIEAGDEIGFDPEKDKERFFVSETGLVIIAQPSRNLVV